MKRNFLLLCVLLVSICWCNRVAAQECASPSGPGVCDPQNGTTGDLPCALDGIYYDEIISVTAPSSTTVSGTPLGTIPVTVDHITVDSINNLPCGLCWRMNSSTNTINGGQTACIRITGVTLDDPGQYKLRIIIDATATYVPLNITQTQTGIDASTVGLHYYMRVKADSSAPCPPVDTSQIGRTQSIPGSISAPLINSDSITLCPGGTGNSTLTVSGGNYYAYAWSTGGYSASTTVHDPGTYTVTVYDNCASATASKTILPSAIPPASISPAVASVCRGSSTQLTASGGITYLWSNSNHNAIATVSPSNATTYTVTVTNTSGCTATASRLVSVTPPPVATIVPPSDTICAGGSANLTASGGVSYSWSNLATTTAVTVSPAISTNYTVTVTDANNCTAKATRLVSVINVPVSISATGTTTFCTGGSVTLKADSVYATYSWSTGAITPTIAVSQSGTYTCTVTQAGCQGVSNTITVTAGSNLIPLVTANPSFNICTGASVTLDAGSGYTSYHWSNSGTHETTSTSIGGPYSVTVTSGTCTGSATVTVNVGNFPAAVHITPSGPTTLCVGQPLTLDAGSGYQSYSWSNGGQGQTIQPTVSGNYSVTITKNLCIGSDTLNITFIPLPHPVITPAGPLVKCVGDTVTLDAGPGFDTYDWSTGDNTESINIMAAGDFSVTVTQNSCTGSSLVSDSIKFNPVPVPIVSPVGNQSLCTGQSVTLDAGAGYSSYLWSNGATTQTTTANVSGACNVTVTQNGCNGSLAQPDTVTVYPIPAASLFEVGGGSNYALLEAAPGNASYVWLTQQTATGPYTVLNNTLGSDSVSCSGAPIYYSVIVTQHGCSDTSAQKELICTAINNISSLSSFSIHPNPANDVLFINFDLSEATEIAISVFDIMGRRIMDVANGKEDKGAQEHEIKLTNLAPDIYILNFATEMGSFNTKFVKQ